MNENEYKMNNNIYTAFDNADENFDQFIKDFDTIWDLYPNKKGKQKAFQRYLKLLKGVKVNNKTTKFSNYQICEAVLIYAKECEDNQTPQQYIKHGDTFFNSYIIDYIGDTPYEPV